MEAEILRNSVQKMYSNLDYYKFCEYMGLKPKYDEKYWWAFQKLSESLTVFDDDGLQKIIDYSKDR